MTGAEWAAHALLNLALLVASALAGILTYVN